jgi:hypothetical protein
VISVSNRFIGGLIEMALTAWKYGNKVFSVFVHAHHFGTLRAALARDTRFRQAELSNSGNVILGAR